MPPKTTTAAKETERAALHKTIWRLATELRGSVDGWDFKQYVLGILFYRYISENLTGYLNAHEHKAGDPDFDYATLADDAAELGRKETIAEKGFYILPSELFANVRTGARHDDNLNETLERVFNNIEGSAVGTPSEYDLKGLFDHLDVNSSKLGQSVAKRNEKLVKLLEAIGDLELGAFTGNTIDAFGALVRRTPTSPISLHASACCALGTAIITITSRSNFTARPVGGLSETPTTCMTK